MLNQKGQTLLETVLAVGVILIGLVSLIALFTATNIAGRQSTKQVVAANLAREGIEVARHLRDSNWLAIEDGDAVAWADGLYTSMDPTSIPIFDTVGFAWSLSLLAEDFVNICPGGHACSRIYQDNEGRYLQFEGVPKVGYQETDYSRLITITPISNEELEVVCEVQWEEQDQIHSYQLIEHIYDWKYY